MWPLLSVEQIWDKKINIIILFSLDFLLGFYYVMF